MKLHEVIKYLENEEYLPGTVFLNDEEGVIYFDGKKIYLPKWVNIDSDWEHIIDYNQRKNKEKGECE